MGSSSADRSTRGADWLAEAPSKCWSEEPRSAGGIFLYSLVRVYRGGRGPNSMPAQSNYWSAKAFGEQVVQE